MITVIRTWCCELMFVFMSYGCIGWQQRLRFQCWNQSWVCVCLRCARPASLTSTLLSSQLIRDELLWKKSIWKDPTLNKRLHKLKFTPFFSRFLVILQSAAQFWLYSGVYNFEADNGPERRHQRMPESSAPDAEEMGKAIEATGHIWSFRPCPKHSRGRHWGRDEALRHHVSQRQKISVFTTDRSVSAVHHIELLCDCLPF